MLRMFCLLACLGLLLVPAAPSARAAETPEILNGASEGFYAVFKTNHGEFAARLFADKVPITVANFVGLAQGTKEFTDPRDGQKKKEPYYDGTIFHRVIDGFMIQGGDRTGTGRGGPGYSFSDEFSSELKHTKAGILSMANAGPNTNGSQFFVTVAPTPHLDGRHSVFGEVVKGLSVVMEIAQVPTNPSDNRPIDEVKLEQVRIYHLGSDGKPVAEAGATTSTEKKAEDKKTDDKKADEKKPEAKKTEKHSGENKPKE